MKFRVIFVLLTFALIFSLIPVASAQDEFTCLGLSADDCAVLTAAQENMNTVSSMAMEINFDLSMTGLAAMDPTSSDLFMSFSGTGNFAEAESTVPFNMTMSGSLKMDVEGQSQSFNFNIVIVDNVLYMQLPDMSGEQWMGMPLEEQLGGFDFSELATGGGDMTGMIDPATMEAVSSLLAIPGFITHERLADESMMDQTMYPFNLTVDFAPLFTAPEFNQMLQQVGEAAGDPSIGMLGAMLPMLVKEGKINLTQWIGANDNYLHKVGLDLDATIDASALSPEATEPLVFDMHLDFTASDYNGSFEFTAPEGAQMIDPETSPFQIPGF